MFLLVSEKKEELIFRITNIVYTCARARAHTHTHTHTHTLSLTHTHTHTHAHTRTDARTTARTHRVGQITIAIILNTHVESMALIVIGNDDDKLLLMILSDEWGLSKTHLFNN